MGIYAVTVEQGDGALQCLGDWLKIEESQKFKSFDWHQNDPLSSEQIFLLECMRRRFRVKLTIQPEHGAWQAHGLPESIQSLQTEWDHLFPRRIIHSVLRLQLGLLIPLVGQFIGQVE